MNFTGFHACSDQIGPLLLGLRLRRVASGPADCPARRVADVPTCQRWNVDGSHRAARRSLRSSAARVWTAIRSALR